MVALIITPVSNPQAILYSSDTKTLHITRLHLINNQQRILALLSLSTSIIIKPIQKNRSWLLAKDKSIKIINLKKSLLILSQTKWSLQEGLLIYHYSYLLSCFACFSFGLMIYIIKKRLKIVSSWQTVVIQAPLALQAMYQSFNIAALQTSPLELVRSIAFTVTKFKFQR